MNILDIDNAAAAAVASFDNSFDTFVETSAADEIRTGKSRLSIAANRGLNKRGCYSYYSSTSEPCVGGESPCDIAQNTRLTHLARNMSNDNLCTDAFYDAFHAADKTFNRARISDQHIKPAVAASTGVRNARNILDFFAGRVIVDGELPSPYPTVDLSLVIRDLPDRQRSVAERLMAGDSAADIARTDGVSRASVTLVCNKIRAKCLAADTTLADGRVVDGRRQR